MAEEIKNPEENASAEQVSQTPNRDAWRAGLIKKNPDLEGADDEAFYKASTDGYDAEHELNKKNASAYESIYSAIERSPESARVINGLINPEEGAEPEEAFAYFGEELVDLLTGKIDKPAYREKKAALRKEAEDKKAAEEAAKAADDELNVKAGEAFVAACEEVGIEPEEAEKKLMEKFKSGDSEDFRASQPFYVALLKSLSYDDDMLAAEQRGRNANIQEKKGARGASSDGMPRTQGAGGGKSYDPNSLAAINMRRARLS